MGGDMNGGSPGGQEEMDGMAVGDIQAQMMHQ